MHIQWVQIMMVLKNAQMRRGGAYTNSIDMSTCWLSVSQTTKQKTKIEIKQTFSPKTVPPHIHMHTMNTLKTNLPIPYPALTPCQGEQTRKC